jgi:SAM-dependent methyltransferase
MTFPIEFNYSTQLPYHFELTPAPPPTPAADHAATTQLVAAMMQSVYDLAGELRGLGPVAHTLLRQPGEPTLRQRVAGVLRAINALRAEIEAVRNPHIYAQLQALGVNEYSRELSIHIGCGGHHLPGWINLDNYPAPLAINLAWGLPLPPGSARHVFVSHLLEHLFYPAQSHRLLDEIRRVLQPGGIVRIVVPDIEQCLNAYVNNDVTFFTDRRKYWTWLPEDLTQLESFLTYAGVGPTPEYLFENHKFGYDFATLKRCLERTGFVNIRRCKYQGSPHKALRVDHASENASAQHSGGHYSLFVEAEVAR